MSVRAWRGLEGAWIPIAANVSGQELIVGELRVKYLVLDGHDYSIIDRTNQIVDSGEYLVDERATPRTDRHRRARGPECRPQHAGHLRVARMTG